MARFRRFIPPGTLVHVISRFVNREPRILEPAEREEYLARLGVAFQQTDWSLLSYGIMSTHPHWGALSGTVPFESLVKRAHSGFARWLNRRQGRVGPVFADRPKTISVEPGGAGQVLAYHHNNPSRAGLVEHATDSNWTSHRAYLTLDARPPWLDATLGLALAGFTDDAAGRSQFDEFVKALKHGTAALMLTGADLRAARREARERTQRVVELSYPTLHGRQLQFPVKVAEKPWRGSMAVIINTVCNHLDVPKATVRGGSRCRGAVAARRLVVLVGQRLGKSLRESSWALGITEQSAGGLVRRADAAPRAVAHRIADRLMQEQPPVERCA